MKNYVGKKIRGFKFEDGTDGVKWNEDMVIYIGEVAKCIRQNNRCLTFEFDDTTWGYPISLIEPHLIEETPEISGLEALLIVHGGWHGKEEEMLYDKCFKIIQQERKRLQSIYIKTIPKYTHAELVEKLGHDFEIIK
jgi:hypothetical protein